ncbi:MAG: hypothetical protein H0Z32_11850 [Bacillaceae bacterium]|nr:hypothetical protein [Bacillaceae bacterium]
MAKVVVIGTGFSGQTAALYLRKNLGKEHDVTVINPWPRFTYIPSFVWVGSFEIPLSPREQEVFILTLKGFSQKEIAERMSISVKTVENHRRNIRKKLGSKNKGERMEFAQKYKLLELYK